MRIRRSVDVLLLAASLTLASPSSATIASYEGWWWNAQQSGHGVNIGQQRSTLFVSWFTYDEAGAGMWLTLSGALAGNVLSGQWIRTTGPALGAPFDPAQVTRTVVGTGSLTFAGLHEATLAWTISGKSGSVALTRTTWTAPPMPRTAQHNGRMYLDITVCPGGQQLHLPIKSTYTVSGNTITIVDDFRQTGTKVCTMTGTLTPSGSYFSVSGTYSCVDVAQTGAWQGTLLVRDAFMIRDEVLLLDTSDCVYNQSAVTSPAVVQ